MINFRLLPSERYKFIAVDNNWLIERFSIECRKPKTKVITTINQKIRELKVKPRKLPKAQENTGVQVVIGFRFASDWMREWCEFFAPIIERSEANPKQSLIT